MRNSTAPRKTHEQESNVVYHFECPDDACQRRQISYIGLTTSTLKRRMQGHRNSGAIHAHFTDTHDRKPLVAELIENTKIINREPTNSRLRIAEAVSIELRRPTLNIQTQFDLVLPSNRRRSPPQQPREGRQASLSTLTATTSQISNSGVLSLTEPNENITLTQSQDIHNRGGGRRQLRNWPPGTTGSRATPAHLLPPLTKSERWCFQSR